MIVKKLPLFFIILTCSTSYCQVKNHFTKSVYSNTRLNETSKVSLWLTDPYKGVLFQKQKDQLDFSNVKNENQTIEVNDSESYQPIDGFGYCLTGGSAMLINHMNPTSREALLKELFATGANNIGVSYLRISIGASDLDDHVFSYDDLPKGQTDESLEKFSIEHDRKDLVPVLKEIMAISPKIKILGSPWSPPTWMKTNDSTKGGSLKPEYYKAYANYFVKYIQAMKAEGIDIDAITIQNEPLHPGNNPSMLMLAPDQARFIKNELGPAFKAANINTKIIIYDHNADKPDYPISILNDPEAKKYIDGSAFHLYAGPVEALTEVHNAHPDKNLYFTEQWVGAPGNLSSDLSWHVRNLIIGAPRNWARTVLEWNLAADPNQNPHTEGGCDRCLGAVTIDRDSVTRNPAYYIIAHASKLVRPGSVRIASNADSTLPNVAFKTPSGKKVLIVQNDSKFVQTFNILFKGKTATARLNPGAVGTYEW
jgi:glucosylceramidase